MRFLLSLGKLIRRQRLPKNDFGENWHWKDLNNGVNVTFYGRIFHLYDCDKWTKVQKKATIINSRRWIRYNSKAYLLGLPWKRGYRCKSGRNRTEWPLHSQATGSGEIARLQNQDRLRRSAPVPRDGPKGASNVISLAFKWQQWMYWWRRELLLSLWFVGFAVLLCLGRPRSDVWRNSQVYFARE